MELNTSISKCSEQPCLTLKFSQQLLLSMPLHMTTTLPTADEISFPVHQQLIAYNSRDIDAFMQWWADDCEYYEFPSRLIARGTDEIRERHLVRFKEPNLFGRLIHRAVIGNVVFDYERVTRTFPEGAGEVDVFAIYEVTNGKIAKAWFKIGTVQLG